MQTITLQIQGMSCGHCTSSVQSALSEIDGVENVEVTLEPGAAVVSFDDTKTEAAKLKEVVEDEGYSVL